MNFKSVTSVPRRISDAITLLVVKAQLRTVTDAAPVDRPGRSLIKWTLILTLALSFAYLAIVTVLAFLSPILGFPVPHVDNSGLAEFVESRTNRDFSGLVN